MVEARWLGNNEWTYEGGRKGFGLVMTNGGSPL